MVIIRSYKCGCRTCVEFRRVSHLPDGGHLINTGLSFYTVEDQIAYALWIISVSGDQQARKLLADGLAELRKRAHQREVRQLFRGNS